MQSVREGQGRREEIERAKKQREAPGDGEKASGETRGTNGRIRNGKGKAGDPAEQISQ